MEVQGCTDIAGSPDPPEGTGSREANGATLLLAARRARLAGASEAITEIAEGEIHCRVEREPLLMVARVDFPLKPKEIRQ